MCCPHPGSPLPCPPGGSGGFRPSQRAPGPGRPVPGAEGDELDVRRQEGVWGHGGAGRGWTRGRPARQGPQGAEGLGPEQDSLVGGGRPPVHHPEEALQQLLPPVEVAELLGDGPAERGVREVFQGVNVFPWVCGAVAASYAVGEPPSGPLLPTADGRAGKGVLALRPLSCPPPRGLSSALSSWCRWTSGAPAGAEPPPVHWVPSWPLPGPGVLWGTPCPPRYP